MDPKQTQDKGYDLKNVEPLPSVEENEQKAYPGMSQRQVRQEEAANTDNLEDTDMTPETVVVAPATQGEFRVGAAPIVAEDEDTLEEMPRRPD